MCMYRRKAKAPKPYEKRCRPALLALLPALLFLPPALPLCTALPALSH